MATTLPARESPQGKQVSLFVTCLVDTLYPHTGLATVDILRHVGTTVDFPQAQTCCGQPGFNAGYRREARSVATHFLDTFRDSELIVTPSGSCAAMIRHEYPHLFQDDPALAAQAQRLASITWELSEFIVDGLGISDLGASLPQPQTFAFHDSCHGLRLLNLGKAARALVSHVKNASLVPLAENDVCCGFGGLFAVKMADVSGAMLQRKLLNIEACPADAVLTGDVSCLMHMNGGLKRQNKAPKVRHVADVLAEGIRGV